MLNTTFTFLLTWQVGLGTDVSGGFAPSILAVVQHASMASKVLAFQSDLEPQPVPPDSGSHSGFTNKQLSVATLFYLATLGGAQVCDIDKEIGSLTLGKKFDALLVNLRSETGNPHLWNDDIGRDSKETPEELLAVWLERFLLCGDDRNISRVYVQGRFIGGKSFQA